MRLGLLEATEGRSISTTERDPLYCYHYDPQGKHYSLVAMNVMRLGGGLTPVVMGGLLAMMWAREYRKRKKSKESVNLKRRTPPGPQPCRASPRAPRSEAS